MKKVTIITPVLNGEKTIERTIKSVLSQKYSPIEHIIVDGGSSDKTLNFIKKNYNKNIKLISEQKKGVYPAMNTGLKHATGEIIGILNADDFYSSEKVISKIVSEFEKNKVQAVWSDLAYVERKDQKKIVRYWKSSKVNKLKMLLGWMPPHPTLFISSKIYKKLRFKESYKISADYDLSLRLFNMPIKTSYIPEIFVYMCSGGKSGQSPIKLFNKTYEDILVWKGINGYLHPLVLFTVIMKKLQKIPQFFIRPVWKEN